MEDQKNKISAIIPIYGNFDYTQSIVTFLIGKVDEIIVVNNKSCETEDSWLKEKGVKVISNKKNLGWTKAINQGIKVSTGEYVLFLNNDLKLPYDLIPKMVNSFVEGVGCVCPLFTAKEDEKTVFKQDFTGFCFMVSRTALKKVSNFDETMLMWYSDNDYYFRLKKAGFEVLVNPEIVVHHWESKTILKMDVKKIKKQIEADKKVFEKKWGFLPNYKSMLAICVPTATKDMPLEFVQSLIALKKPKGSVTLFISDTITDMARNLLVEQALSMGANEILFLDADMVFDPDLYLRLASYNKDIISAFAYNREHKPCVFIKRKGTDGVMGIKARQGLVKIDYTGLACTLIKTDVFKFLKKPYFNISNGVYEYIYFYKQANKLFKIYCDTDIIVGHLGEREVIK